MIVIIITVIVIVMRNTKEIKDVNWASVLLTRTFEGIKQIQA